jgi:hypothetical protein
MKRILLSFVFAVFSVSLTMHVAVAQDEEATPDASPPATPAPVVLTAWAVSDPVRPEPSQCTVEPASTDEVAESLLALESRSPIELTSSGIVGIAATAPADGATVDGVLDTLTQFWACNNAGNRAALVAGMTPSGIADLYDLDLTADEATVRAAVAAALTPGEPRTSEELASIEGVISVVQLKDGRIAALVLNSDPRIAGGAAVQDLFVFEAQSGQYLIDGFVGDPFDTIDGYGYDAE